MWSRLSSCLLVCSAALATSALAQDGVLAGRLEGGTYLSATGEYKITSPILPELGGTITDSENVVTFSDSFNTHISIACFPQDASEKWEQETRGTRDYLLYFFNSYVLADFDRRFPGSTVESARYLPELNDGALATFAILPGGSYFEEKNRVLATPADHAATAKRGTLLFVHNRHVYIISYELAERVTQRSTYHLTVEQEDQLLTDRLVALAGRLVFTGGKSRK